MTLIEPAQFKELEQIEHQFAVAFPDQSNCDSFYDKIDPAGYDQHNVRINFTDPANIAEATAANVPCSGRVYDVGAGTGIMARELRSRGYTHIEGADASP